MIRRLQKKTCTEAKNEINDRDFLNDLISGHGYMISDCSNDFNSLTRVVRLDLSVLFFCFFGVRARYYLTRYCERRIQYQKVYHYSNFVAEEQSREDKRRACE